MATAKSTGVGMWGASGNGYQFYGVVTYSCTRNNANNTYTVTLNNIEVHGKDWNFAVNYDINLNNNTTSGTIPATGNSSGERSIFQKINVSTTVYGTSTGYCPEVKLNFRVWNDHVYFINKGVYVSFSSSYTGDISSNVLSESGGPNIVWTAAGAPTITSITDNHGSFNVTTTMGRDGQSNAVSNVHLYYSFTNPNPTVSGANCYGLGNGSISGRTVTFSKIPYTASHGTVYMRAYSISAKGDNPGSGVSSSPLSYRTQPGAPTINSITDNHNNTYNIVTTMGRDGANNPARNVHIYWSNTNANPYAGDSQSTGLTGGVVSGKTVTFKNVPIPKSGYHYFRAYTIADYGNNALNYSDVTYKYLTYYGVPTFSTNYVPTSKTSAAINITTNTGTTGFQYRLGGYKFASDESESNVSWSGDIYDSTTQVLRNAKEDDITTYYIQIRRTNVPSMVSTVEPVSLDLRIPKISNIVVSNIQLSRSSGNLTATGQIDFNVTGVDQNLAHQCTFDTQGCSNNTTQHYGSHYTKQINLLPDKLTTYRLLVYRSQCSDIQSTATVEVDTRLPAIKEVEFKSVLPRIVDTTDNSFDKVNSNLSEQIGRVQAIITTDLPCTLCVASISQPDSGLWVTQSLRPDADGKFRWTLNTKKFNRDCQLSINALTRMLPTGTEITTDSNEKNLFTSYITKSLGSSRIKEDNKYKYAAAYINGKRAVGYIYKDGKWYLCTGEG